VEELLGSINATHATAWTQAEKLAGGYQQGAYRLASADGGSAVLKWHRVNLPQKLLIETARTLEEARGRGWRTPRWLAFGPLADNGAYVIEEFIDGIRPRGLDGILESLLGAIELQAGARPVTDQDWSSYIYRCVFAGEADLARRMRARPETAALLDRLERFTSPARGVQLPTDDLVHGDFVLNNVVVRNGEPWLVDAAHAGKGTRVYDLATLLFETSVGGDSVAPEPTVQRRLERQCLDIGGKNVFLVTLACRIMHLLVFGGVQWSEDVPRTVARCFEFLDALEVMKAS
jgi:hypothetical protein